MNASEASKEMQISYKSKAFRWLLVTLFPRQRRYVGGSLEAFIARSFTAGINQGMLVIALAVSLIVVLLFADLIWRHL